MIDGASDSVIKTMAVGAMPRALIYNPINKKVYCGHESGDVIIIDGETDTIIKTIRVGSGARAFAWNPLQNRVYVANYWSWTVAVLRDSIPVGIEEREPLTLNQILGDRYPLENYPNPAKSVIRVRGSQTLKQVQGDNLVLKIFDASGKLIKEIKILKLTLNSFQGKVQYDRSQEIKISLKEINQGIYFLQLGNQTKKFLVIK